MLFGIDTSGKIGQGGLYISIVENRQTSILNDLRKKVEKRHMALASRRRIKASNLNSAELNWFIENFGSKYSCSYLSIGTFSFLRNKFMRVKNWQFKILACTFYLAMKKHVKDGDVVLIDRDYSEDVMKLLMKYLHLIMDYSGKLNVTAETGTSFNEVIVLADMIAGCGKRGALKCAEIKPEEISYLMRILN
ncbi:hypothetical protein HY640_03690 [Candidatus Woesearchaeota archaeon]|nr:hypothetical protein [Candidatus Woesearchaeota archaeon]